MSRDILEHNPCTQIPPPGKEHQRDRVLNVDEIRAVLAAWQTLPLDRRIHYEQKITVGGFKGSIPKVNQEGIKLVNILRAEVSPPQGALQISILNTKPFQTGNDDKIQVFRSKKTKPSEIPRDCPERSLLIESLADALLQYETQCVIKEKVAQKIYDDTKRATAHVDWAILTYTILRKQGKLSMNARSFRLPGKERAPNGETITKARKLIIGLMEVLTPMTTPKYH